MTDGPATEGRDGAAAGSDSAGSDPAGRRLRVDLHAHTSFSPDSTISPDRLVRRARDVGLDRIAVTDHGVIGGALAARRLAPELVIVGEEIRCDDRTELIGLFLGERVPEGLPLEETAARIHAQGGVVYLPHPFAYLTWPRRRARRALALADAVEAYNSRAFWPAWNRRARRAGAEEGLPLAAGSDAHFPGEIGQAYTELPSFDGAGGFRAALASARPVGRGLSSPAVHVASAALKVAQRLVVAPDAPAPGDVGYAPTAPPLRTSVSSSRGGPAMG